MSRFKVGTWNLHCEKPISTIGRIELIKIITAMIDYADVDFLCVQEIVTNGPSLFLLEEIPRHTKLTCVQHCSLSNSIYEDGSLMGLAIFSKYMPAYFSFHRIKAPYITRTFEGVLQKLHDKGIMICDYIFNGYKIKVITHHGFPFHSFEVSEYEYAKSYNEIERVLLRNISDEYQTMICADFNTENLQDHMPRLTSVTSNCIVGPTRLNGRCDDYILINNTLSHVATYKYFGVYDHYFCVSEVKTLT